MITFDGKFLALTIIIAAIGLIEFGRYIYNKHKLEEEVIDLRRRLGR